MSFMRPQLSDHPMRVICVLLQLNVRGIWFITCRELIVSVFRDVGKTACAYSGNRENTLQTPQAGAHFPL